MPRTAPGRTEAPVSEPPKREIAGPVTLDRRQSLIRATALCQMLLDELERLDGEAFASEEFVVELRELCERGHAELSARKDTGE
jgi:hypothetical protein